MPGGQSKGAHENSLYLFNIKKKNKNPSHYRLVIKTQYNVFIVFVIRPRVEKDDLGVRGFDDN